MDISVPSTNAPTVQGQNNPGNGTEPTYTGYTGNGVAIGIVDTGLDLAHQDFHDAAGNTRVVALWDQTAQSGGFPPPGYQIGVEFTPAQINANHGISADTDGRGTHMAGIAAGGGKATGNGKLAYRYIGMAPKADLIICKSTLVQGDLLNGVAWVFQKAAALRKPVVCLIAQTNQVGAHDGSSSYDQSFTSLIGTPPTPGRLLVCPVGQEGQQNIHAKVDLLAGGTAALQMNIPAYGASTGENVDIQMWHESTAYFRVRLTSPGGGVVSSWVSPGTETGTISSVDGAYFIRNDLTSEYSSKGGRMIRINIYYLGGSNPRPKAGTWTIDIERVSPATTGRLDAYVASWRFGSGGIPPQFFNFIDNSMKVASPASADGAIAVSAYTTRKDWIDFLGQTSFYTDFPPVGEIYDKSNRGPLRNNTQSPHICAPGEGTISALCSPMEGQASNLKADDWRHWIIRGTHVAAAHVAGALALRLEQIPTLTATQAIADLQVMAHTDQYTGAVWNDTWGGGKLFINNTNPASGPRGFRPPTRNYPFEPAGP